MWGNAGGEGDSFKSQGQQEGDDNHGRREKAKKAAIGYVGTSYTDKKEKKIFLIYNEIRWERLQSHI